MTLEDRVHALRLRLSRRAEELGNVSEVWVCPDSVDTPTMQRGQVFPDLFLSRS